MTKDELYELVGHSDLFKDLDVKTLVLDQLRENVSQEELLELMWRLLPNLKEETIRGYFYRRHS